MRDVIILLVHVITIVFRLAGPGGLRSVVAESVLMKHQLLIMNRSLGRAPNFCVWDRLIAGFCSLWIKPTRLVRVAHRFKTVNAATFPSGSGPAKVSAAVFAKASSQAWAKRPQPGRNSRRY